VTHPSAARLPLGDDRAATLYNVRGLTAAADAADAGPASAADPAGRPPLVTFNAGLACCALEATAATALDAGSQDDRLLARLQPYSAGAQGAEVLVVSGTVTDAMVPAVRALYAELVGPRFVVSYGACSNSGGPYWDSYAVAKGVDQIVPVDVYVPGCPPGPKALLDALRSLPRERAA
jgi:NADH-quinone oxidoreductase subunit B